MNEQLVINPADIALHERSAAHAEKHGATLLPGELGYEIQQAKRGATIAPATPTPEKAQADASKDEASKPPSLRVPDGAFGYHLHIGPNATDEQREGVKSVGEWFRTAELPASAGRFIGEAAMHAAREPMTEAGLAVATQRLHANLRQAWGNQYDTNLAAVRSEIDRVDAKHGGKVWEFLDANPAVLSSPAVIKTLLRNTQKRR